MNKKKIINLLRKVGIGIVIIATLTLQIGMITAGGTMGHGNYFGHNERFSVVETFKCSDDIDKILQMSIENTSENYEDMERMLKELDVKFPKKAEEKVEKKTQYGENNMITGKIYGQYKPHDWFLNRLNNLARDKGMKLNVMSGFRSVEEQTYLFNHSNRSGKMVAPPGKSRHNCGLAVDVTGWGKDLSNEELKKYGLYKPMGYEDWHIEPVETKDHSTAEMISKYGLPTHLYVKK